MKSNSSQSSLSSSFSSKSAPNPETEKVLLDSLPAGAALDRTRIRSLHSELRSLLQFRGKKNTTGNVPVVVTTPNTPQIQLPDMASASKTSSVNPTPIPTATPGELLPSSEAPKLSPSIRSSTLPPRTSVESLASSASLQVSPTRTNKPDSIHSKVSTSQSPLDSSSQSIHSQTEDSQAIPSSSKASIHSTVEEREFCNELLSHVLSERRSLIIIMENLKWPDFLSLSQCCRGARRAALEGYSRGKGEGRGNPGVGKNIIIRRTGSRSSLSSQRSISPFSMTDPVKEEVLVVYVEGYRYLAGRIARIISRRNAREATTSRYRSTRTGIPKPESIHSGRNLRNSTTRIQKPFDEFNTVKVSLEDLQLLYLSSLTPLHAYPTHALASLCGPSLSRRHSSSSIVAQTKPVEITQKLRELTLAHSKFVLVLRNIADQLKALQASEPKPSSNPTAPSVVESEGDIEGEVEEDLFDVHAFIGGSANSSTLSRFRRGGLRELVFPAPLSGSTTLLTTRTSASRGPDAQDPNEDTQLTSGVGAPKSGTLSPPRSHHTRSSTSPPSAFSRSVSSFSLASPTSHTKASSLATARSSLDIVSSSPSKRLSFTRSKISVAPPPLPSEPQTLKAYSNGWRRSLLVASESHRKRIDRRSTLDLSQGADEFGRGEADEKIVEQPRKLFTLSPSTNSAPLPSSGSDSSNASSTSSSRRNSREFSTGDSSPGSEKEEKVENVPSKELRATGRSSSVQFDEKALRRMSALEKLNGGRLRLKTPSNVRREPIVPRSGSRVRKSNHPSSMATSPHDLVLATSTLRAPVLRVYVPCSDLTSPPSERIDQGSDYFVQPHGGLRAGGPRASPYANGSGPPRPITPIERVEAELIRAGVWESMRGGEVVVNFGYMPGTRPSKMSRPTSQATPKSRSRTLSPSRESQTFANFTPSPGSSPGPVVNGKTVVRSPGRLTNGAGPSPGPPSAFRSPSTLSYETPGPSRHTSVTNLVNMAHSASQGSFLRRGTAFANANPSRQSTYDSFAATSSSAGPSRQSSYYVDSGRQAVGAKWLIFDGSRLVPYSPSPSQEALVDEDATKEITKVDESFLPLDDPLSLPSPFYYDHILGAEGCLKVRIDAGSFPKVQAPELTPESTPESKKSHIRSSSDPFSIFAEFGSHFRENFSNSGHDSSPDESSDPFSSSPDADISMSLQTFPTTLRSPGSTSGLHEGWVTVRRWRWVAKALIPSTPDEEAPSQDAPRSPPTAFKRNANASASSLGEYGRDRGRGPSKKHIGRGWLDKTWTLEGEGTKEGRETLVSCLKPSQYPPSAKMEWEIVRERTTRAGVGKGVLWFRLLTPSLPPPSFTNDEDGLSVGSIPTR